MARTSTSPCTGPQELAKQTDDADLAATFEPLAETLAENEQAITAELIAVQGSPVDVGGYYRPDAEKTSAVMRPSPTFNEALAHARLTDREPTHGIAAASDEAVRGR